MRYRFYVALVSCVAAIAVGARDRGVPPANTGTAAAAERQQHFILRVAAFNVEGENEPPGKFDSIGRSLRTADIAILNEIFRGGDRVNQPAVIKAAGGFQYMTYAQRHADGGRGSETGEVILSRSPISNVKVHVAPRAPGSAGYARRLFVQATVTIGGTPLTVFATRLANDETGVDRSADRRLSAEFFVKQLLPTVHGPVILAGDLNDSANMVPVTTLKRYLTDAFDVASSKENCTDPRIDYVLFRGLDRFYPGMSDSVKMRCYHGWQVLSDHPLVIADIGWLEKPARRVVLHVVQVSKTPTRRTIIVRAADADDGRLLGGEVRVDGASFGRPNRPLTYAPKLAVLQRRECGASILIKREVAVTVEQSVGIFIPAAGTTYQGLDFVPSPRLALTIACGLVSGSPGTSRVVEVEATDAATGAKVTGTILIDGQAIGPTGQALPRIRCTGTSASCSAIVRAPGYPDEPFTWW
jgi:endonuclease/exonuclease/phosphatase family metal-dependent hydrolase